MDKENTILPSLLIDGKLTVEEIGAIFVAFSLPNANEEVKAKWSQDPDLIRIFIQLQEKNMLQKEGDKITINIDDPQKEDFFYIDDYDDKDNPIYASPSPFGDEETGAFMWKVRPELWDMKIIWINCSDADLMSDELEHTFDSLEDAESYFREINENIIKSYE
jgi:hypothetical protein